MKTIKALFIGGSADGQWRDVIDGQPFVQVMGRTKIVPLEPGAPSSSIGLELTLESYRRERVRNCSGTDTDVYVYDDTDALQALIDGYRKPPPLPIDSACDHVAYLKLKALCEGLKAGGHSRLYELIMRESIDKALPWSP